MVLYVGCSRLRHPGSGPRKREQVRALHRFEDKLTLEFVNNLRIPMTHAEPCETGKVLDLLLVASRETTKLFDTAEEK